MPCFPAIVLYNSFTIHSFKGLLIFGLFPSFLPSLCLFNDLIFVARYQFMTILFDQNHFERQIKAKVLFYAFFISLYSLALIVCFNLTLFTYRIGQRTMFFACLLLQCSSVAGCAFAPEFGLFCLLKFVTGTTLHAIVQVPIDLSEFIFFLK